MRRSDGTRAATSSVQTRQKQAMIVSASAAPSDADRRRQRRAQGHQAAVEAEQAHDPAVKLRRRAAEDEGVVQRHERRLHRPAEQQGRDRREQGLALGEDEQPTQNSRIIEIMSMPRLRTESPTVATMRAPSKAPRPDGGEEDAGRRLARCPAPRRRSAE